MNQICGFARILLMVVFTIVAIHAQATITVLDYWRLGEMDPSATAGANAITAIDGVGNHNLTFHGPATYSTAVAATASTHTGSSLSVNFANTAYATNAIVSTLVNNFGIECWVKPTTVTNGQVIVYNGNTALSGWGMMVSGGVYQALYGGKVIFGTHAANAGVWTHLALVRTNGTATLYINGVAADTSSAAPNTPNGNFGIASPPQISDDQFLIGLVDEVRCFTIATGQQFKTNDLLFYQNAVITPSPASLVEGPAGGIDGVGVNASPASAFWTASSSASWLRLNKSSGVNSNFYVLGFSYDANPGPTRTGSITVDGQSMSVMQAGSNYVAAGVLTLPANGLTFASGVGVDGTSNVYISDVEGSTIDQWIPGNTNLTTWLDSPEYIVNPESVFVDSAHNVLIADLYNDGEPAYSYGDFEWVASSQTLERIGIGGRLTEDSAGNIYGNNDSTNLILRFDWAIGGSWVDAISSGLSNPTVLAADRQGNLYLYSAYFSNLWVYTYQEWNPASQTLTNVNFPGVASINCMAVDEANNLYIGDNGNGAFEEWNAASQTLSTLAISGGNSEWAVAVDPAGDVYFVGNGLVFELPRVFVNSTAHYESGGAGADSLSALAPATASLTGFYQPTSDQPWLTITTVSGGNVGFAFTGNTSSTARTANINILGVSIPVTQASSVGVPPFLINPQVLGNGAFQFTFTNLPNASFTVLTTTNLSLPLAEWTVAGAPASIGPGLYQFTSQPPTNGPQQFFEVTSP